MGLSAEDTSALRDSVRATIVQTGDADRVASQVGAVDLLVDARSALAVFFEEFGRAALANNLIDVLIGEALGLGCSGGTHFVFPVPRRGAATAAAATERGDQLDVDGLLQVGVGGYSGDVVVVTAGGSAITVPVAELTVATVSGFDPAGDWRSIRCTVAAGHVTVTHSPKALQAIALARLAAGSELLGLAMRITAIAIEHVSSRHQFGKALGSFQTVRHRLAEAHVANQAAQTVLNLGWAQAEGAADDFDFETYAIAAKALAGKAFEAASLHANQVCGGMGLTWEHPLPALVRRGSALNVVLGGPVDLAAELGRSMAAGVALPVPDPLVSDGVLEMAP